MVDACDSCNPESSLGQFWALRLYVHRPEAPLAYATLVQPKMPSYISSLNPTIIFFPTIKVGALRFPVGPRISLSTSSSVRSVFFKSTSTTFLPRAETSFEAFFRTAIASSFWCVSFFASTSVLASIPAFARNSCVFVQVFQPRR